MPQYNFYNKPLNLDGSPKMTKILLNIFQWLKRHNFSEKFFVKNAYFLKFCRGPIFIVFWLFWLYNMSDTAMFFFQGYTHALDTWAVGCILGNYSSSSPSFIKVTFWNFSFHIKTIYKKWRTVCIKSSQYLRNNEWDI